jgi:hypothetical protein
MPHAGAPRALGRARRSRTTIRPGSPRAGCRRTPGTSTAARMPEVARRRADAVGHRLTRKARVVYAGNRKPVVVVGALGAVGRRPRPEPATERECGPDPIVVDAHEGMPEAVDAAVAPVARSRIGTHGRRLTGPSRVDVRGYTRDEPLGEAGAAARIVAARQVVHERRQRDAGVAGVRASNRVHKAVAVGEGGASLSPGLSGNRVHSRSRVVPTHDHRGVLARVTSPGRSLRESPAALGIAGSRFLSAREQKHGHGRAGDPARTATARPGHSTWP